MRRFEFIVPGPPVSAQGKRASLQEWKKTVRAAARTKWRRRKRSAPARFNVRVTVVYYHDRDDVLIDEDNLLKPIQDSLNGLVYADDRFVTDGTAHKRPRFGPYVVAKLSSVTLAGFRTNREFLHILVEKAPDPRKPVN